MVARLANVARSIQSLWYPRAVRRRTGLTPAVAGTGNIGFIAANRRIAATAGLTLLGCSLGLAAWLVWSDHEVTRAKAATSLSNLVGTLEKDISRSIELDDLTIRETMGGLRLQGLEAVTPEIRHAALFSRVVNAEYMEILVVLDESGNIVVDSEGVEPRTVNFADRDYFQVHRENDTGSLYVSRPIRSRLSGSRNLVFSRRLSHPDGSFAGVVAAGIKLAYFQDVFKELNLGQGGSVTLLNTDGIVIARWPSSEEVVGLDVSATDSFQKMWQSRAGQVEGTSISDGVDRTYAFRRVGELPLIVTVAFATDDIYAEWRRKSEIIVMAAAALLGIAALLGRALFRELALRVQAELDAGEKAKKLADAAARLDAVFQHSADALYAAAPRADGQFAYETVNPKVEEFYGKPASDLLGRTPQECLPSETARTVTANWMRCVSERHAIRFAKSLEVNAGRRHWELLVVPMHDQDGGVCRLIGAVRDDTERMRMEAELLRLNAELEQRVTMVLAEREAVLARVSSAERMQALGQLAGGIAHDFNNVLQGVSGCAVLIERRSDDPATARRLARLSRKPRREAPRLLGDCWPLRAAANSEQSRFRCVSCSTDCRRYSCIPWEGQSRCTPRLPMEPSRR